MVRHPGEVYSATLALQEELYEANLAAKASGRPTHNTLLLCEHPPTYTLGKSGDPANMLFKPEAVGASFHQISRGGDITYHGPGQLVVYPIFDLDTLGMGPASFVAALEDTIILLLADYGLTATRLDGAPGIWLDAGTAPRKICAVGMKISRGCTMHGIALNINTDLRYFSYIVPCGLPDKAVTSMAQELGRPLDMAEVSETLQSKLRLCLPIALH
ncbi:MAG: lipoyl(octanoyl) transferase LipB [Bacteroidetes bacterium]|nr:lipoyl(octanoyl) transferase LipB [Bacteroidota bacterium]